MKSKIQILDYIQIFVSIFLGLGTKLLESITNGNISTIFGLINICALLILVNGVFNTIEDIYGIKLINLK